MSVFVKPWPFISGLDGSLSDSTITSSGDGGCFSFLTPLLQDSDKLFLTQVHARLLLPAAVRFRVQQRAGCHCLTERAPLGTASALGNKPEINNAVMAAEEGGSDL